MNRIKLKKGGCRRKAIWGEAITAAATLAAAGIQAAATAKAASDQSKAVTESAKTQREALLAQNANNNQLQKQSIDFTRSQNEQNRQQQQDIQMTLQAMAGQQNMNDRLKQQKVVAKCGHRTRLANGGIELPTSYGGAQPFKVTDGGGVLPIAVDNGGYGLYELVGNDHEHYHKTRGKYKSGVGIKFPNGEIVEGEGNQNTNSGELLYVTPQDALFLSKHSIKGFNPAKAVKQGMNPEEAYQAQEILKAMAGIKDDGKKKLYGGYNLLNQAANSYQMPNAILPTAGGVAYLANTNQTPSSVARNGARIKLKCGGKRRKATTGDGTWWGSTWNDILGQGNNYNSHQPYNYNANNANNSATPKGYNSNGSYWNNYGGATLNAAGSLLGAGLNMFGNMYGAKLLSRAYNEAGNTLADAYGRLKTIDMSILDDEDTFDTGVAMAAISDPNYRNTAERERVRRNAVAETRNINRNTLSSAARQQRLAATNDRYGQRINEIAEQENNINENRIQGNMQRITQTSAENANRKMQMRQNLTNARLSLAQYNNDIENMKIAGAAQAQADAMTQSNMVNSAGLQAGMQSLGNALVASGNAFGTAYNDYLANRNDFSNSWMGLGDIDKITGAMTRAEQTGDFSFLNSIYSGLNSESPSYNDKIAQIAKWATNSRNPRVRRWARANGFIK